MKYISLSAKNIQHFCEHCTASTPQKKYLIKFDVYDNTVTAPTGTENEVYRIQQKEKSSNFSGHVQLTTYTFNVIHN